MRVKFIKETPHPGHEYRVFLKGEEAIVNNSLGRSLVKEKLAIDVTPKEAEPRKKRIKIQGVWQQ